MHNSLIKIRAILLLNLKSKVVSYFEEFLRERERERSLFFARDRIESTQRGWREAERLKSVKRNETYTGGRTGSNRVSLVFQHPPWARSSSAAFAKGEKRSNRYSVFVLSDVKRIGRDKTSGAEEGWNEPFHRGGALQFLRSTLSSFSIHRPLSFPISLKISLSSLSSPFSTFSTTR